MECNLDRFPEGLRVLVVDDDPICLLMVERLLRSCLYQVTTCGEAVIALSMLRENRSRFDVVISDVYMPNMDGFKLLELVRLEMDVPFVMMSANGETSSVMKGISQGACDYLLKPVRIEELQNIWQHVVRKKQSIPKQSNSADAPEGCQHPRQIQADGETALQKTDEEAGSVKKRNDVRDEDIETEEDNLSSVKRQRVVWSVGLHQKFVSAVNQLGLEQAVPKRILDLMNVPGLTRENVASHLQKFRLYLKRISGSVNQPVGMVSCTETSMDSFAWINGHSERQAICSLPKLLITPQMGSGAMHHNESSSINQLAAEICTDHQDLLLPQRFEPTFQTQGSVDPVLKDPINVHKSDFIASPGQRNLLSQNCSDHLILEQCHSVPQLNVAAFGGGVNYSNIEPSNTRFFGKHLRHAAQPESQSTVFSSLNGMIGVQQGFEVFPTNPVLPAMDCSAKKSLENSVSPQKGPSNDCSLPETSHKLSSSKLNSWLSVQPSRTFVHSKPCLSEDAPILPAPKVANEDQSSWRPNSTLLNSYEMNNVQVVCPPLRRQCSRNEESEVKENESPGLSLPVHAINGKQNIHSGCFNVTFEQSKWQRQ